MKPLTLIAIVLLVAASLTLIKFSRFGAAENSVRFPLLSECLEAVKAQADAFRITLTVTRSTSTVDPFERFMGLAEYASTSLDEDYLTSVMHGAFVTCAPDSSFELPIDERLGQYLLDIIERHKSVHYATIYPQQKRVRVYVQGPISRKRRRAAPSQVG